MMLSAPFFALSAPCRFDAYGEHLHAPQIRDDEEIQCGYGGSIPPQAGSEKRTGQGADYAG